MRIIAIIPAKGNSSRLPGKNLAPFPTADAGSLVAHKIGQLHQTKRIDEVIVGSDDPQILEIAQAAGAQGRLQDPYHCNEGACPLRDRWRNLVAMTEGDLVVWAHCTNPLVPPELYDRAIEQYLAHCQGGTYDSLASVTRIQRHAWQAGAPLGWDPWKEPHPYAAQLEPILFQDGAIFIQPHAQMMENGYFYGEKPLLYEIPNPLGWDIDTERDLVIGRAIYGALSGGVEL